MTDAGIIPIRKRLILPYRTGFQSFQLEIEISCAVILHNFNLISLSLVNTFIPCVCVCVCVHTFTLEEYLKYNTTEKRVHHT
jgi:hypothetical protein